MAPTLSNRLRTGISGKANIDIARLAILVLGLSACFWGIWSSGREGLSQLFAGNGLLTNRLEETDWAIKLNPATAEAHYARASLLYNQDELAEAIKEYERAVALRPHDYALWLELGRARDQANDVAGALAAFREATQLAPFYAQPHWQLGNTLLRSGRRDEALAELRSAANSDPRLLPAAINFGWALFDGDAQAIEQALQPQTAAAHLALASVFAKHGKASEAVAQFRAAGTVSNEQRRTLLADLLGSKDFAAAFAVWSSGRQENGADSRQGLAAFANGGFEEPVALDDPGFGWQLASNLPSVRASLDPAGPHAGTYSLRLDWNGDSPPATPIISELVLVEPKMRYRLSFAARTQEMLTIGLPLVTVSDARDSERVSGQSQTFPRGTSSWQDYAIEFVTGETTEAVLIVIRRQNCATTPCAAIGHAWVDDFFIQKL
jgi:Tfp pilus assembly protein PilF